MKNIICLFAVIVLCTTMATVAYTQTGQEYISETAMSQGALFRYLQRCRTQDSNRAMTNAGAVMNATKVDLNRGLDAIVDGKLVRVASGATTLAAAIQASSTVCAYLFCVDGAGALTAVKGTNVDLGATPVVPTQPAGVVAFAQMIVTTTGAAAFTLGTTNVSAVTSAVITHFSIQDQTSGDNFKNL